MLPGFDARPLRREFKRFVERAISISQFALTLLNDVNAVEARNTLGLGAGSDIASAATLPLAARTGNLVRVTGAVASSATDLEAGGWCWCEAVGLWPLTYHATNFPVQGGQSYTCQAGDLVFIAKDGSSALTILVFQKNGKAIAPNQIQPVPTPTFAANAMTVPSASFTLDFRNATEATGGVTSLTGSPAALVVPSGATLGFQSGVVCDIALWVINNAGALEYGISNANGGVDLSERVVSTTTISAAATSASVIYSTTGRSNVAPRLVGIYRGSQATAGQWSSAMTLVQGVGGNAFPPPTTCQLRLNTATGYGSTNNRTRRFTTVVENTLGIYATYTDSAALGGYITTNVPGFWSAVYSDQFNTSDQFMLTLNEATPTSSPAASEILGGVADTRGTNVPSTTSFPPTFLPAGSVIRTHVEAGSASGSNTRYSQLILSRLG